jgi:hypothetical protein
MRNFVFHFYWTNETGFNFILLVTSEKKVFFFNYYSTGLDTYTYIYAKAIGLQTGAE